MDVSLSYFLQGMAESPVLLITVLLTLGVIFVNGWTDAPNAIATCITTRCLGAPPSPPASPPAAWGPERPLCSARSSTSWAC